MYQNITHWLFDMDGTLYPENPVYDEQVWALMDTWLSERAGMSLEEAKTHLVRMSDQYGDNRYGFHKEFGFDYEEWDLAWGTHADHSSIPVDPALPGLLKALPGQKIVFTDSDQLVTEKLLKHLQVDGCFDEVSTYTRRIKAYPRGSKETLVTYEHFQQSLGCAPAQICFFENRLSNLEKAKQLGWKTVLVHGEKHEAYVDAAYADLPEALIDILEERSK